MIAAGDKITDLVVWLHICCAELMRADQMTGCFVTLQEGDNSASGGLLSPLNTQSTAHLITYYCQAKEFTHKRGNI